MEGPHRWPRLPAVGAGMRIGLLGGSFNPAHAGHRQISVEAITRLRLDQVWWIVSPGNPLKEHKGLRPLAERVRQAEAVARHPRIVVTGFEADLASRYTADTLAFLCKRLPTVSFVWLMGADNLAQLPRWRRWRQIMQLVPIAVMDRPGWRWRALASKAAIRFGRSRVAERDAAALPGSAPPAWVFLTVPLSPLSSTAIRAARGRRRRRQ